MEPLEIVVVEVDGGSVFRIAGDLDLLAAPVLLATIRDTHQADADHLTLDMTDVTFLDSSGIAALIELQQTDANCNPVVLVNPTEGVVKVLELGGVLQLFEVRRVGTAPS